MEPVMMPKVYREIRCGEVTVLYVQEAGSPKLGLWLVPTKLRRKVAPHRQFLSGIEIDSIKGTADHGPRAWMVESLLQLKASGDDAPAAFAQGRSLRNSVTVDRMALAGQVVTRRFVVVGGGL